jgi:hypothetical protein
MYLSGLLATPGQAGATAPSPQYHTGDILKRNRWWLRKG